MKVSVVLCTYNPRPTIFPRALQALKEQEVPLSEWELLLVDNNSSPPLQPGLADWHPNGKLIRESKPGKLNAIISGIRRSGGELIVFVDDDNLLGQDYIANALSIFEHHPQVGVFGGNIELEPETEIPSFWQPHLDLLAQRVVNRDMWGCFAHERLIPCGAGMCATKSVLEYYAANLCGPRKQLDRNSGQLTSGGDTDIALTACDMGLAIGMFRDLHLTHVIPAHRLSRKYMLRLMTGISYSSTILAAQRNGTQSPACTANRVRKVFEYALAGKLSISVMVAKYRGQALALRELRRIGS